MSKRPPSGKQATGSPETSALRLVLESADGAIPITSEELSALERLLGEELQALLSQ